MRRSGECELSRAGRWGSPERYQRWQYRFASYPEALAAARSASTSMVVNGMTWDEYKAWAESR
ncbi:hypothetical protein GCM10009785_19760 [Brooklawnia cerclae]|uniref:Uncharacterized protein n=1 Tax=Brooklawnia cerclae TaxID=349934 RepID=A0ABX0SHC4_9ACTN|nr:hypothetical protein [Brooklawnia cerclae]NIH57284.1 hypothetical protein [Brooklawnia cerclae]